MEKGQWAAKFKINFYAWLLLLPSLIFLILFTFYPVIRTLILSFYQADLGTPEPLFNGIENYRQMLEDEVFWKVLRNNLWITLVTVPTSMALAMMMALYANKLFCSDRLFLSDRNTHDCHRQHLAVHLYP